MAWSHLFTATSAVYENMWLIQISQPMLRTAGYSYAVLSLAHWVTIMVNIAQSIRRRRFSFGYDASDENEAPSAAKIHQLTANARRRVSLVWETTRTTLAAPLDVWERYFGMNGWFGVHGALFYVGFYLRQAVEIAFQTYQAYMISRSLPSEWINRFVVSMIVINCLYTPVLSFVFSKHVALRRVLNLTLDIYLDSAIAVIVPIVSMVPTLQEFEWEYSTFPSELVFNDVWITTSIMTARQTMVNSRLDYISSMCPHITCLAGLDTIKRIIQRTPSLEGTHLSRARGPIQGMLDRVGLKVNRVSLSSFTQALKSQSVHRDEQRHRTITRAFHGLTVAWAIAIIAIHVTSAKTSTSKSSCALGVNAWATGKVSCAVATINCHRLGIAGARGELASILNDFERPSLSRLVFSHCPALEIPDEITQFSNMIGITTFNTTLVDWSASGAVTTAVTPHLLMVYFVDTNFTTSIPAGILHRELPANTALTIFRSNLTELPSTIGATWWFRVFPVLVIEYTNLRALPASFETVLAFRLALGRNQLRVLPDGVFQYQSFQRLRLSGNPLTTLPTALKSTAWLTRVWFEHTNVSARDVPPFWTDWWAQTQTTASDRSFSLFGSPACDATRDVDYCRPAPDVWRDEFPYETIAAQYRLEP